MRGTLRIVLTLFLGVLILSNYNAIRILNHAIQFLESDLKERAQTALHQFTRDIEQLPILSQDLLKAEMTALGIRGLVLYSGAMPRTTITPDLPEALQDPLPLFGRQTEVKQGNYLMVTGVYKSQGVQNRMVLIFDARRLVQIERTTTIVSYTNILLMVFAGILVIYFFESAFRPYRQLMQTARSEADGAPEKNEADFLIGTFNSVILKLREKEHELERLHQNEKARADDVEQLNQDLVRSISSGLILIDSDKRIRYFNEAAESILQKSRAEALHQSYSSVLSASAPELMDDLDQCFHEHLTVSRAEVEIRRPDSQIRYLGAAIMPMQDRQQHFAGVLCLFSDITDFKKLQQHMAQKEKFATLGEMAGGVAHEFRNSVATIAGYVQLLESRAVDHQRKNIQAIQTELQSLQTVISEFLSFARPVEPEMTEIALGRLLEECMEEVRVTAPATAEFTLGGEFPRIEADEAMLRQVFLNLIRNAAESIEGTDRKGIIEIRGMAGESDGTVVVEIRDNGTGIPQNDLSRIFTPFFTTKRQGVGLGLAIVQKLVLQHNGSINVASASEGTVFRILLPCAHSTLQAAL